MAQIDENAAPALPVGVGPRLKAARESAGLSLAQISDQTKIPTRMLVVIEAGDFAALPAKTYATGFTRSYARALGLDEVAMVASVRAELGLQDQFESQVTPTFEPGDPSRVPSAQFAWLAAVAALIVVAAGLFLWRTYYNPAVSLPSLLPEEVASVAPPAAAPVILAPPAPMATEAGTETASEAATQEPTVPPPARAQAQARRPLSSRSPAATPTPTPAVPAPLEAPETPVPGPASTAQN